MNVTESLRSKARSLAIFSICLVLIGGLASYVLTSGWTPAFARSAVRYVGNDIIVSDTAGLESALKSARGGQRILLEPGEYARMGLSGVRPSSEVIVTSRNPANRAVLREIDFRDGGNLTFDNLIMKAVEQGARDAFLFQGARNLKFRRILAMGHEGDDGLQGRLIFVRDSEKVSISESEFTHAKTAISLLDTRYVTVTSNYFHELRMDGIRGGGNSDINISYNYFTNFMTVPPDHPDAIQFWSKHQKVSARNITIVGNVIYRGEGRPVQGIFMNDEEKNLPYHNVRIEDNVVVGAMYNGITVQGNSVNLTIVKNTVSALPDMKSWIRATGEMRLTDNRAPIYLINGKRVVKPENNETIPRATDNGVGAIKDWAEGRALDGYAGSLRSLVATLR